MTRFILFQACVVAMAISASMSGNPNNSPGNAQGSNGVMKNECAGITDLYDDCVTPYGDGICIPFNKTHANPNSNDNQFGHYRCERTCDSSRDLLRPGEKSLRWIRPPAAVVTDTSLIIAGVIVEVCCKPGWTVSPGGGNCFNTTCTVLGWDDCDNQCVQGCPDPSTAAVFANSHLASSVPQTTTFQTGNVVTYTCNNGYVAVGNISSICTSQSGTPTWTPVGSGSCEAVCTDQPPAVISSTDARRASTTTGPYLNGNYVPYECPEGKFRFGDVGQKCDAASGTWVPKDPSATCIQGCPPVVQADLVGSPNAQLPTGMPAWSAPQTQQPIECAPGYTSNGNGYLTCTVQGTTSSWEASAGLDTNYCSAECGAPDASLYDNAQIFIAPAATAQVAGAITTYACNEGFSYDGCLVGECKPNGQWQKLDPTSQNACKQDCASPSATDLDAVFTGAVLDADFSTPPFQHGDFVALACPSGYQQQRNMGLECHNGAWRIPPGYNTNPPQCVETCDDEPAVSGFVRSDSSSSASAAPYLLDSEVAFVCPLGSVSDDGCVVAICKVDSMTGVAGWEYTPTNAQCEAACNVPSAEWVSTHLAHAVIADSAQYVEGEETTDHIQLTCKSGGGMQGVAFLDCVDGEYEISPNSNGTCRKVCGDPDDCYHPHAHNATNMQSAYLEGQVIIFECDAGFYSPCPQISLCTSEGWTHPQYTPCRRTCEEPDPLAGQCDAIENPVDGNVVQCTCDFDPPGSCPFTGTCEEDARGHPEWSFSHECQAPTK